MSDKEKQATFRFARAVCSALIGQVMLGERGKVIRERYGDVTALEFAGHVHLVAVDVVSRSGFEPVEVRAIKILEDDVESSAVDGIAYRKAIILWPEFERLMLEAN